MKSAESAVPVTALLHAWRDGDPSAAERLIPLLYGQLRALARKHLSRESPGHTLPATALVHEAYLKIAGKDFEIADRVHFLALASRVMRRLLIDHARTGRRGKRGGGAVKLSLDEAVQVGREPDEDLLALDAALTEMAAFDPRKAELIETIYFGGMTVAEAAEAAGVSESTAAREVRAAKAWLYARL
ncbi:MAG: ECF-type sigma factor [Bryobacteraceae bacterium]|nr:ECF-type sigma factor [Bryobacteraceae bacterium]